MSHQDLGVLVGRLIEKLKAIEEWKARWDRRARWAILAGLGATAAFMNAHSPKAFGEAVGGFFRAFLTGG